MFNQYLWILWTGYPLLTWAMTLPDLATRAANSIVALEGGLINISGNTRGGYPRAIATKNGTLLAQYAGGGGIQARASYDQGATWDPPVTILAPHTNVDETNGYLFQEASGDILCAYRNHVHGDDNSIIQLNLGVSKSTDGGKTWSNFSSILSEKPNPPILKGEWEPFLWHNSVDDNLEVYWSHELNTSDQNTVKKISPDGGKTWGQTLTMTGANINARDGMPNIAALDATGRNLLLVFETNRGGTTLHVWASTSTDGGATWANARTIFNPEKTKPGRSAGGPGIVNVDGTLVVSFMTDQDAPSGGNYTHAGTDMKVITSTDEGKSWSDATTVIKDGSWGGITIVGDGAIVLATHADGEKAVAQKIKISS